MRDFKIEFDFASLKADGDVQHRTITIRAKNAREAENIAWMQRGTNWGAYATDYALDCRAI